MFPVLNEEIILIPSCFEIFASNTLDEIEVTNVSLNQGDYLKVCTEIISIISASNYEDMTLSEYYENKIFNIDNPGLITISFSSHRYALLVHHRVCKTILPHTHLFCKASAKQK